MRTLGKRVRVTPSRVRIPLSPQPMKEHHINIQQYSPAYKDQVRTVIGTTLADISVLDREDLPIDDPDLEKIDEIYSGKGRFWVALEDDRVVGTVAIRDLGDNVATLNRMFVLVDQHGSGVGQRLFDEAMGFAQEQGFTKVVLNTHELMGRAHHFYEKNGFVRIGKTGDKFHYEKTISPQVI